MTNSKEPGDVWAIGDIQGCAAPLEQLLGQPLLSGAAQRFWFAGDLVNRGPDSLGALRRIIALGTRAQVVLGNHDLHLLAVAAGVRKQKRADTFGDILQAPDSQDLIDWLRRQPLMVREHGHVMVHAGILPAWDLDQAQELAAEIEHALRGPNWRGAVHDFYGEDPIVWHDALRGAARMRLIVNAFTRMRMCYPDGQLCLKHKGAPKEGKGLLPWFAIQGRRDPREPVVFGHWSTLGLHRGADAICLDTGCVWGRCLSALRLRDHFLLQQDCAAPAPEFADARDVRTCSELP